jgi:hypothetical protein
VAFRDSLSEDCSSSRLGACSSSCGEQGREALSDVARYVTRLRFPRSSASVIESIVSAREAGFGGLEGW